MHHLRVELYKKTQIAQHMQKGHNVSSINYIHFVYSSQKQMKTVNISKT